MPQVVIASRLVDGRVVFLGRHGHWSEIIEESRIIESESEGEESMESARQAESRQEIVDPYLTNVVVENSRIRPVQTREQIRAAGPTVRKDLGKQAEG